VDAVEILQGEHRELQSLFSRVSSPDENRPEILKRLMQLTAIHLDLEKQMLLPVIRIRVDDGAAIADRLRDEHRRIEKLLTTLDRRKVNSPDVPDLVTKMLHFNDRHISESDSVVLPGLRFALSAEELDKLGDKMISDERRHLTHPHTSLPDSGPLSSLTRKIAEFVDRMRDHSTDIGRSNG
jgi:hemerythrin-like domain-containing protein